MNTTTAKARIADLIAIINEANRNYYELDAPTLSDAAYDKLFRELQTLEHEHPELRRDDSPTRAVGTTQPTARTPFGEVAHREPMLSLDNALDETEFQEFHARTLKALGAAGNTPAGDIPAGNTPADAAAPLEYLVEYKFDGLAIELVYEAGALTVAATRGDG
ncbi:MAG: hypothetical protein KDD69_10810, partial [Bdellovibrionales bacterium]|nr:hypothetical protein [Bdellovibrionales bacterium]